MNAGALRVTLKQAAPIPLDAAFEVAPGELLALVGPSGAGKTTILRGIAGLMAPNEGRVECAGEVWFDAAAGTRAKPQARRVGIVFQDYALFPHLTARENVALALGRGPADLRRARADALLARVHLSGLEDRRPRDLSGGQRQRVALARALAREPAALLLDEPFAAVDQVTRRKLQRELAQLRAEIRAPTVLVTHDLSEAAMLADRMTVLHRGRTLQTGAPLDVMRRPASPLVARLMDQPNVFEATVAGRDPAGGFALLDWHGLRLEARDDARFAAGQRVAWSIPAAAIVLHSRLRPSRGERENPVSGVVDETLRLGETVNVTLRFGDGAAARRLVFAVGAHTAERNELAPGRPAAVSLLAEAINLMPSENEAP
jgi:molybdate transport system ATP-binding protein